MTHKWSNSSWWSKTATLAAFRKQCRHINSKLCQLFKKKIFLFPALFPPRLLQPEKKSVDEWIFHTMWVADSFADTEEQFIRDLLRSAPQMSQIRPAAVFLPDLPGPEKSPPLQSVGTIVRLWILMTSVRTCLIEATTSSARDQIITPSFVSFAVKATFSGSRRRNRPADGWDLLYFPILFNAVVFFPPSRSLRGGSGVHL